MKKYFIFLIAALAVAVSCKKTDSPDTPGGDVKGAVDLGLTVKWASMNLGASSETDAGKFYAWGETSEKSSYTLKTYKYISGETFTRYNVSDAYKENDNLRYLKDEDDAVKSVLGKNWKMPRDYEWNELREKCTWEWVDSPVPGYVVKSKTNSNRIFLPAAGFRNASDKINDGKCGYYWTSSLDPAYPGEAFAMTFGSDGISPVRENGTSRIMGLCIRPVVAN